MKPLLSSIRALVADIAPYDDLEACHRAEALEWLDRTHDVFRRRRPDVPSPHLVSYLAVLDETSSAILLVDHVPSGLLLPPGGHVDPGEHPWDAARREMLEELFVPAVPASGHGVAPFFLTITSTRGPGTHTDVSFWFVVTVRRVHVVRWDEREFTGVCWMSLADAAALDQAVTDPHLGRFVAKLMLS